jgi:hypothetical protein
MTPSGAGAPRPSAATSGGQGTCKIKFHGVAYQNSLDSTCTIPADRPGQSPSTSGPNKQTNTSTDHDSLSTLHAEARSNLVDVLAAIDLSPESRKHAQSHAHLAFTEADAMRRAAKEVSVRCDQQSLIALQMAQRAVKSTGAELREHARLLQAWRSLGYTARIQACRPALPPCSHRSCRNITGKTQCATSGARTVCGSMACVRAVGVTTPAGNVGSLCTWYFLCRMQNAVRAWCM